MMTPYDGRALISTMIKYNQWYIDDRIVYSMKDLDLALSEEPLKFMGYNACLLFDNGNGHEQMDRVIRGEFKYGLVREVRYSKEKSAFTTVEHINRKAAGRHLNFYNHKDGVRASARLVYAFVVWPESFGGKRGGRGRRSKQKNRWFYKESRSSPGRDDLTDFINRQV